METLGGDRSPGVGEAAQELYRVLSEGGLRLVCAESCTGGMVAAALTDLPGASSVLWGGVVAYSNECKARLLGVPASTIAEHGAVSREVAGCMARGALALLQPDSRPGAALAITGIAGPEGGSEGKPVGLVWFAFALGEESVEESAIFPGDRKAVREAAARHAMRRLAELAGARATGRY